ncbi:MAG: hypothetical protein HYR97_01905 [Candidatus Melainabacteria bacterium]|nr:hypothetical protein [Candidatus Melainabacteria bacterium]
MFILDAGAINNAGAAVSTQKKDNVVGNAGNTQGAQKATVTKPNQSASSVQGQKATVQQQFDAAKTESDSMRSVHGDETRKAQDKENEANNFRSQAVVGNAPTEAKQEGAAEQAQSDSSNHDAQMQTAMAQANQAQQEADLATQQAEVALGQQLTAEGQASDHEREVASLGNQYTQTNDQQKEYEQEQAMIKKTQGGGDIA